LSLGWEKQSDKKPARQRELFIELSPDEEKVVTIMKENNQVGIDEVVLKSELPTSKVAAALLSLEFQGIVRAMPGKVYKLEV
jgi:DNA processing protein